VADSVQIPVEFTGWDKVISSIEGTTKASKEMGEQFKKALMGEVLVQGIQRIASGMKDGIAKETTAAAGAIAQGFFMGGPAGAAIAGFSVAVLKIGSAFDAIENKAGAAAARLSLAGAQANAVRRRNEGLADVRREQSDIEIARIEAGKVRKERDEQDRIAAAAARAQALAEKKAADADAKEYIESQMLSVAYLEQGIREEAFQEELDAEAEQAMRVREQRTAAAEEDKARKQRDDLDQWEEENRQRLERLKATAENAKVVTEEEEARRDESMDRYMAGVAKATDLLFAMDAMQIQAAASAGTLAGSLAEAAARGVSAELQAIAQRETVLALADGAAAVGRVAFGDFSGAGILGSSAAQHAAAAVAAGAGAVALNTVATAAAPAVPQQPTAAQQRGGGGSGGGITVNLTTSRIYSTGADVGADITASLKNYERYRGYR